jgi:uncharacterized HAD superfamily protein
MRLGIDIDGCLANFNEAFGDALIKTTGRDLLPDGWKTNSEFPTTWNWDLAAGYTPEESKRTWEQEIISSSSFWASLPPYPDTAATLKQLNRLSKRHDVYFLTHRMGKNCKQQTEEWLAKHGMDRPTVIISGQKLPIIVSLGLNFFIDDKLQTVNEIFRAEVPELALFLKNAPWNQVGREKGLKSILSVEAALREVGLWSDVKRGRPRKET